MEKKKNWSIRILVVSVLIFAGYICYATIISDNNPPEVTCDTQKITVSVKDKEKELIKGVTAIDDRSGDVTKSIIVEKIGAMVGDEREITYAAVDEKGNVGRASRTLKYRDYKPPTFDMEGSLRFPAGTSHNLLKYIKAESTLDGDLTDKIKCTKESVVDTSTEGSYEVEYRVSDSTGTVSYLPLTVEIYDPLKEKITITLSEYLVYLEKGESFNPYSYYQGATSYGGISVKSDVNTQEPGIYTIEYTMNSGGYTGQSNLIVIVEDEEK